MKKITKLPLGQAIALAKEMLPAALQKGTAVMLVLETEARVRQVGIDHKDLYTISKKRYDAEFLETPYPGDVIFGIETEEKEPVQSEKDSSKKTQRY